MGDENAKGVEEILYECPVLKVDFNVKCKVHECTFHVNKFKAIGLNPKCHTNCVAVDFQELYGENIAYAVIEQGRVGYRDIEYMSEFFGVSAALLREVYEYQDALFRVVIQVIARHGSLEGHSHCTKCGRPECDDGKCEEVFSEMTDLLSSYLPTLTHAMSVSDVFAIAWLDHHGKRTIFNEEINKELEKWT